MKSISAIALAACMLLGCSPEAEEGQGDATPKPALQRLVGTLSIVEDYAIRKETGVPFLTRTMVLQGKIDQPVEVGESTARLDFSPAGGVPLRMTGTVSETGKVSLDDPDSNAIVKTRGDSRWTGKLGEYELSILRSKMGAGDEIHLRFNTPMEGKTVLNATDRNGTTTDLAAAGGDAGFMGLSLLEPNPSDHKPMFKREYDLFPKLGAVPAEPFEKQLHEGIARYPAMFHLGLVTSPGRNAWTYSGTKVYSKPGSETQWTEKVELSLKLVPR
jgi:hypothetical protein